MTDEAITEIYKKLRHPWLPKCINTFLWLILTGGLSIGEWLQHIDEQGECQLWNDSVTQTTVHAFIHY